MLKLMTILFKDLLNMRTNGIADFMNSFTWYVGEFYFNCCSQLIDRRRFCAIKLNESIKWPNCIYETPQNAHITIEYHVHLPGDTI